MPAEQKCAFVASVPVTKKDLGPRAFLDVLRAANEHLGLDLEGLELTSAPVFRAVDYPNEGFDPRVLVYTRAGTHFLCRLCFYHSSNGALEYTDFIFHFINPSPLKTFVP